MWGPPIPAARGGGLPPPFGSLRKGSWHTAGVTEGFLSYHKKSPVTAPPCHPLSRKGALRRRAGSPRPTWTSPSGRPHEVAYGAVGCDTRLWAQPQRGRLCFGTARRIVAPYGGPPGTAAPTQALRPSRRAVQRPPHTFTNASFWNSRRHRCPLYPTQKTAPEWDGFIHFLEITAQIYLFSKKLPCPGQGSFFFSRFSPLQRGRGARPSSFSGGRCGSSRR